MNPMTNMKNVLKLSEQELRSSSKVSWHDQYRHSAWVFVGGLPYDLTEGDIICVFSQYGEVVNINLVRDKGTGKSRGFCFICYEDQRSTNLAVDNFNGVKILNRTIRVDHCEDYKAPKDDKMDEETRQLHAEGCAPGSKFGKTPELPSSSASNGGLDKGLDLPSMEKLLKPKSEPENSSKVHKEKKSKKEKREKSNKDEVRKLFKKRGRRDSSSSSSDSSTSNSESEKAKRKKSHAKGKRSEAHDSSSSSEESGRDSKKRLKGRSKKCSSSEEENITCKEEKRVKKEYDKEKSHDPRRNVKSCTASRYSTSSRDQSKESYGSQKMLSKSDRGRDDYYQKQQDKDRNNKYRDESRRYETPRNSYEERRGDRGIPGDKVREESRHHEDRRRRDNR